MGRWPLAALILLLTSLAACAPHQPLAETQTPTPQPITSLEAQIAAAYALEDPITRQAEVLRLSAAWLNHPEIAPLSDEEASLYYARIAFDSGSLIFSDAAFIRRGPRGAVAGLPDGLGLYYFQPGAAPLLISPWTAGLESVQVAWGGDEFGVDYETLRADGLRVRRFALLRHNEGTPAELIWLAEEHPDWWRTAYNAQIEAAPDFSTLKLTGQAFNSTAAFDERAPGAPVRTFTVEWLRQTSPPPGQPPFALRIPIDAYGDQAAWLHQMAEPSAYASLVAFIELLQGGDTSAAAALTTDPDVAERAEAFGLHLVGRRYTVIEASPLRIAFRDTQGSFTAVFQAPQAEDTPYLMRSLNPSGGQE